MIISEVADKGTSNACTDKADWVELQNTGSSTVSLAGFKLHDDNGPEDSRAFVFASDATLKAGAFLVLCRGDDNSPQFGIGGRDTITLRNAAGEVLSTSGSLTGDGDDDVTWAFNGEKSSYEYTATPTPGRANVFANIWSRERARLAQQHEDGEAFFESSSVAAGNRLPPVVELRLTMSAEDWAYQQANASYELYRPFTGLEVTSDNGTKTHAKLSAGGRARPRGQSTLYFPVCHGMKTFPWTVDVAGGSDNTQRLFGMERFYLRGHYGDASYMREWTAHRMLRRADLPYLRTRTAKLYVNGEYTGLYSLIEAAEQDYVFYRNFGVDNTNTASTKPPFAEGHALYKIKTHSQQCQEIVYSMWRSQVPASFIEAAKTLDPKNYSFMRGEHRTLIARLPADQCYPAFIADMTVGTLQMGAAWENNGKDCGKTMLATGRVERDFGGSDPDTDNNDGRMIDFFNTYLSGDALNGCANACDSNATGKALRNTPKIDVDQFLKNIALYAVAMSHDSILGLLGGNNLFLASPGGSSEAERAYKIVQWDHNSQSHSSVQGDCARECGSAERTVHWSITRPSCRSNKNNAVLGPLLSGEGNRGNMQKYLGYVKEFNEKVFTNPEFIAIMEAHAQAISAEVAKDPGYALHPQADFKDELSASAGKWEHLNLLAFMKARGESVKQQLAALEAGTFPLEVPETEPCQDWRRQTYVATSSTYEEDGINCTPQDRRCTAAAQCFDEKPGGYCNAETGVSFCGEVATPCAACFPHSACGSRPENTAAITSSSPTTPVATSSSPAGPCLMRMSIWVCMPML